MLAVATRRDERLGRLVERRSRPPTARASARRGSAAALRHGGASRRRRRGSSRSGRRASGAPRRCRRRRASASSARTSFARRSRHVHDAGTTVRSRARAAVRTRRLRGDQHEAQVVAERAQRARRRLAPRSSTSACSDEPIAPAARRPRAPCVHRRRGPRGAAPSARAVVRSAPARQHVPGMKNTLVLRRARQYSQASSAVNDRIGAISRSSSLR